MSHWTDTFDVIGDTLAAAARLPGPQSAYVTGAAAALKTIAKVGRNTGKSVDEILAGIRPERDLSGIKWPMPQPPPMPPPLPSGDASITRNEKPKSVRPPGKKG